MKGNQEGVALIAGITIALVLSILIGASFFRSDSELRESGLSRASLEAFYAAEAGLDRVIFEMRGDPAWRLNIVNNEVSWDDDEPWVEDIVGYYDVHMVTAPPVSGWESLWVRSEGRDVLGRTKRILLSRIILENPSTFFCLTLGDLRVGQGAQIASDIFGQDVIFPAGGGGPTGIVVDGNVCYTREVYNEGTPNINITGTVEKMAAVTFPGVDTDRYDALAQSDGYYDGSGNPLYLDGSDLNTTFAPNGLIYATGDIHIEGTYTDSILVASGGSIYIDNNLIAQSGAPDPQIGIFAEKDVFISEAAPDNLTVEAFVVADGGADSQAGIFKALGSQGSKDNFTFKGAIAARGAPNTTAADLTVYNNRSYAFNDEFSDARTIPFLPFIVNISEWKEIQAGEPFPPP